ncbi:DUF1570 domain-containing protein [Planctomicrobium sp. SH668]|uniref:DUF1570 domain-containing protein n=1 Tax=Planctomicrobium sp. SH668 TaxID=3448126 RepID=UPI003F5C55A0
MRYPQTNRVRLMCVIAFAILGGGLFWATSRGNAHSNERVGAFRIRSEVPLGKELGQSLLLSMAQLRCDVEQTLGLTGPVAPIQVNLFQSKETYLEFLQEKIPAAVNRTALFVGGTDSPQIYVTHHQGYEIDIRHECTHAVLHQSLPHIPLWLDEGLAEYFEVPEELREYGNPYLEEFRSQGRECKISSIRKLEELIDVDQMHRDDYRDSWAWVHFLLHGRHPGRTELLRYLDSLKAGENSESLSDQLQVAYPHLDELLLDHLQQGW